MEQQPYAWVREFELAVLRQMVADPGVLAKAGPHVAVERVPSEDARLAIEAAVGYWKRLGRSPTSTAVLQEARRWQAEGKRTVESLQLVARALDEAMDVQPADSAYVVEQVCEEARSAAVWAALDHGLVLYGRRQLDEVEAGIVKANAIGRVDSDPGVDWAGSLAERTRHRREAPVERRWGTGIVDLDDVLRGGLGKGELGTIMAPPGGGKSMYLGQVAAHVMNLGGTVVYFSLEMSESDIVDRLDSAVTQVPLEDLRKYADHVQGAVESWLARTGGACVVKKFPARVTSCRELRAYLQWLRADRSVAPSMLLFDYLDKMTSETPARYEKDHQVVGAVYDEARNLCDEFGCPGWSGSQTNSEGDEASVAGGHHLARAREKWANMDVGVSINRTDDEKRTEQVRLHVFKNRYGVDGMTVGPLRSDYGRGRVVALNRGPGQQRAMEDE